MDKSKPYNFIKPFNAFKPRPFENKNKRFAFIYQIK